MNIARTINVLRHHNFSRNTVRKFRFSVTNYDLNQSTQPIVQEEKFDFEDLKVIERSERRQEKIHPFMKDVFVSIFNRDLLAYPEILNKEEFEALEERLVPLERVFSDPNKTKDDRIDALKRTKLYAGTVAITNNGLALNVTETLRYLEAISSDVQLSQQLSDHWVALEALKLGLSSEQYQQIIDDLITGEKTVALCIKEKLAERITQADFRTTAEVDAAGIWTVTGEKMCRHTDGYFLVLATIEGIRLKAFLVHPSAHGVTSNGTFVKFTKTPSTPLDYIRDDLLAKVFGKSRLHFATIARCSLTKTLHSCSEYVHSRVFGGKPLSEMSTIRQTFGEALLRIYASESAEYFTAGLLDGYVDPDAELEMAMCRGFISSHAMGATLKLLAIPSVEMADETAALLSEMRQLVLNGETLDSVNLFIALNGIHHAGKMMSEEIKQIRNPLFHPSFIMKKVFSNRHQENDNPKLTLFLAEHLHPSMRVPAGQLEYCVLRMKYACETLMSRHGTEVSTAFTELSRLAEASSEILAMTAALARASRSYCIGLRNAEVEMKLAACFVDQTKERVKKLILEIDDGHYLNLDYFKVEFGRKVLDTRSTIVERPINRTFW